MAFRSQAIVQNENIQINRGKAVDRSKADLPKPAKTGNDVQEMQKELVKKCVKKEVDEVMSAVREQSRSIFDLVFPVKETAEDMDDVKKLELEPEVALTRDNRRPSSSSVQLEIAELLSQAGRFVGVGRG